jgi:pimeloyl-ACP methyl ester carboxylesterase
VLRRGWVESKWTKVNGITMHGRVSVNPVPVDAPNVVMIHGIGISSRYFLPTAVLLSPECRVLIPDLPGFGLSEKPKGDGELHVKGLSDWLAAWTRAYGLESAGIIGNSFGCQIAADFARRYPQMVECVVLVGPTTDPQGSSLREQLRRWHQNDPHEPIEKRYICWRDYLDCGLGQVVRSFRASLADHIEGNLPHVKAPTLVVRGSRDPIVPLRWAEEATRLLPNGKLVVIPGAYHTVNFSSPLELVRVIRPFFREHLKPGRKPVNSNTFSTTQAV